MEIEEPPVVAETAPVVEEPAQEPVAPAQAKASDGLAADLAAERKKVKAMEKQLDEFKRSQMSEQEKLQADYKAAAEELAVLRTRDLRTQAAAKAGLSPDLAARLQGDDLDALVEDAKSLKKMLGLVTPAAGGSDAKAGSKEPEPKAPSMDDLLRAIARGGNN